MLETKLNRFQTDKEEQLVQIKELRQVNQKQFQKINDYEARINQLVDENH